MIGTANTGMFFSFTRQKREEEKLICKAHDVAEDMLDAGLECVTMIQRSKTCKYNMKMII